MRKITDNACAALLGRKSFSRGNTKVWRDGEDWFMILHRSRIAKLDGNGNLYIRHCGYTTSTTKERLNGLPGVNIFQEDFEWYLNNAPWPRTGLEYGDSAWIFVQKM